MSSMFGDTSLSVANYNSLLQGWSALPLQQDVKFDAGTSQYSSEATANRSSIMTNYNWTITDGGEQ